MPSWPDAPSASRNALVQAEQLLYLAEAHGDGWGRIQASAILGEVALQEGDLPRAMTCLEQSVGLARSQDVPDWGIRHRVAGDGLYAGRAVG